MHHEQKLRHSICTITVGMLRDRSSDAGDHPCLTLKAWNTRVFAIYLDVCLQQQLAADKAAGHSDVELLLAAVASRALVLWFLDQEKAHNRFLTPEQASCIAGHGWKYLETLAALATWATSRSVLRWKILPKHHEPGKHHEQYVPNQPLPASAFGP